MLNPVRPVTFPQRLKENTPPLTQQAALGSAVLYPVLTSLTDPAANSSLESRAFLLTAFVDSPAMFYICHGHGKVRGELISLLLKMYSFYMYLCLNVRTCAMWVLCPQRSKEGIRSPELWLQVAVRHLLWVLV